jgi:hypothetical protein
MLCIYQFSDFGGLGVTTLMSIMEEIIPDVRKVENVLEEIATEIKKEKGFKEVIFYQIHHYIPTEFICYERKLLFFPLNVLWLDIAGLSRKKFLFFTRDKKIAEAVKKVAAFHGITCKETTRDHFPPVGAY